MDGAVVRNVTAPDGAVFEVTVGAPGSLLGRGLIRALFDRGWRVAIVELPYAGYVPDSGGQMIVQSMRRHYSESAPDESQARARADVLASDLARGVWSPTHWRARR